MVRFHPFTANNMMQKRYGSYYEATERNDSLPVEGH